MRRFLVPAAWLLAAAAMSQPVDAEESKARHHVVLWTFEDDAARKGYADAVRALGADAVSASPSADVTPLLGEGLAWYEDAASGKGTLDLREQDWKPAADASFAARREPWPAEAARRRPLCLRDPAVLAKLEEQTLASAKRATRGAFAIALADEPSMTVRANPIDWCLCDRCAAAFRDEMRTKYDTVAALNASWATDYATWDDVRPWTTAAMKARIRGVPSTDWNLAPWMETRAFEDATFADVLRRLVAIAGKAAPGAPCGITGTQAPSAFGGWDYGRLRSAMSFVEPYDIGLALPICRDLFPAGSVIAQTVFPQKDDELAVRWRLWRGVARGANATIVWSSHDAIERGDRCDLTPYGKSLAADLKLLSAPDGLGAKLARATPLPSGVVILVSQPSIAVRWMLDSVEDGDTWPRRLGSYEAEHSTAIGQRESAWRAVCDQGPRFLDVRDLESAGVRARLTKAVVLAPDLICISEPFRRLLNGPLKASWARIHATGPIGTFDELGRATPRPSADGLTIDPGFAAATRIGPVTGVPRTPVTATIAAKDGGPAPRAELGFHEDGDVIYVVAIPAWDATTSDGGNGETSIRRGDLTFTFTQTSNGSDPRTVSDLRTGRSLGRVATWTSASDAAGGLVFELR